MPLCFDTTDDTNDLYLGANGNLVMLSGLPAVEAACAMAAKSILKEQIYSQGAGLPDFEAIWVGVPNIPIFKSYLRRTLQNVPGVKQVGNITITLDKDVFSYTAQIETDFGPGQVTSG